MSSHPGPEFSARDFVTRIMSPRVAVVASTGATEVCRANHIPSVTDLFKPFGERIEGKVTVLGSSGLPSAVDNFTLRFADLDSLQELDGKMVEGWLADVVRADSETAEDRFKIQSAQDVTFKYLNASTKDVFPWYTRYRDLFFTTTGVSDHETFEHPVACIIAISSSSPDPLTELHQLNNTSNPALTFDNIYMDPTILKYYVLVHDCSKGDLNEALTTLEKMKKTFGLNCNILKLNSATPQEVEANPTRNAHLWVRSVPQSELGALGLAAKGSNSGRNSVSSVSSTTLQGSSFDLNSQRSSMSSPGPTNTGDNSPTFTQPAMFPDLGGGGESDFSALAGATAFDLNTLAAKANSSAAVDLFLHPEKSIRPYGCYLNTQDLAGIGALLKEMLAQSIVPFMERNINHWNEQVAVSRRGIAGRFRRYFGAGAKAPVATGHQILPNGQIIYHHTSPEAQMRKLADWAFMLRDFKFALSVYDTVKKDFASDKAWKYYGGAQEMIGLCLLMQPQPLGVKNDVDHNLESAVTSYLHKAKSPFYGSRATMMYYELLKQRKMYKEAPNALTKMTGDSSDLRNGLFLEQAAHCWLRGGGGGTKPSIRKYAFHMVMAGHRFGKADQRGHALRCYKAASLIYDAKSWALVDDHINSALGRQSVHLGMSEEALDHFIKLLRESQQTSAQQTIYMREFLSVYANYTNQLQSDPLRETFPDFPLPVVLGNTAKVALSSQQQQLTSASAANNESEQQQWAQLEAGQEEDSSTTLAPVSISDSLQGTVSSVGEQVVITLEVKNPLQIPIILTDIVLGCEHSTSTTSFTVPVDSAESAHLELYQQQKPELNGRVSFSAFDCTWIDRLVLEPRQVQQISFELLPKVEGQIKVMGLHCNVEGQVHSYKEIVKRGKRLNKTKEQMMSKVYAEDKSLDILVAPLMPLLEIEFQQAPEMLLSGEVCKLNLMLRNRGKKGLKNLKVKLSHPSFFCIGEPALVATEQTDGTELGTLGGLYSPKPGRLGRETVQVDNSIQDLRLQKITLPGDSLVLSPGAEATIPVWIRGDKIGKHVFLFLFSYESELDGVSTGMKARQLKHAMTTQVLPSLKINAFTRPSTKGLHEFILGIETENLQTVADFEFLQISSMSALWMIEPVQRMGSLATNENDPEGGDDNEESSREERAVAPRQTIYSYYRIRPSPTVKVPEVTPEIYMAKALEQMVLGQEKLKQVPPKLDLEVHHLSTLRNSHIPTTTSAVLQHFSRASRLAWRQGSLNVQFSGQGLTKLPKENLFAVYGSHDIDLGLYWSIPKLNRRGHHYIIGINLGVQQNPFQPLEAGEGGAVPRALYEQTLREKAALVHALTTNPNFRDESPVKIYMTCPDHIRHGFSNVSADISGGGGGEGGQKLCFTPIEVTIKNCSWNKHIGYTLEMLSAEDSMVKVENTSSAIPSSTNPHTNAHPFFWSGPTFNTGYLEPLSETKIRLEVCFTQPGMYDINRWRLAVQVVGAPTSPVATTGLVSATVVNGVGEEVEVARTPRKVIGKGFMQMPNLAHYIQVS